eukprot:4438983-Pyramimonas_sp.AAC.1
MSRSRREDPVNRRRVQAEHGSTHGGLWEPQWPQECEAPADDVHLAVPVESLVSDIPDAKARLACLARQLEPPGGAPLNAIPTSWVRKARQYAPSAGEDHGHCIFWGAGRGSVAGTTELVECKRLEGHDEWFLSVQDEFRRGALSERTHQFLHGRPTDVAGSWVGRGPTCGSEHCAKNAEAIARDNALECGLCQTERRRRQLVATGPDDERFLLPEFVKATAIYPNQDVKCKVARQRAVDWAASEGGHISWVYARDAARHGAFQKRPYTSADKV